MEEVGERVEVVQVGTLEPDGLEAFVEHVAGLAGSRPSRYVADKLPWRMRAAGAQASLEMQTVASEGEASWSRGRGGTVAGASAGDGDDGRTGVLRYVSGYRVPVESGPLSKVMVRAVCNAPAAGDVDGVLAALGATRGDAGTRSGWLFGFPRPDAGLYITRWAPAEGGESEIESGASTGAGLGAGSAPWFVEIVVSLPDVPKGASPAEVASFEAALVDAAEYVDSLADALVPFIDMTSLDPRLVPTLPK